MYRLTARQILLIAVASALFAAITVVGVQRLSLRFQPFASAFEAMPPTNITDPTLATDEQNNIEVYRAVASGVVYIQSTTTVRDFFGMFSQEREGAGSGSIIDEQGDILTNYHVIANSEKLTVSFGTGKSYPARVVGSDPDTDLAVVRLLQPPKEPLTIVRNGEVRRPKLGITSRAVESLGNQVRLPVSEGVIVLNVQPGSGAANAGIRGLVQTEDGDVEIGDIIVAIDGQKISSTDDLYRV